MHKDDSSSDVAYSMALQLDLHETNTLQQELDILDDSEKEEWMCRKKLQANRFFRKELYDQAFDSFHEAFAAASLVRNLPEAAVMLCNLATCKLAMNQAYRAYKIASSAIQMDKTCARAYERRAAASIKLLQFDQAIRDIETAFSLNPDDGVKQKLNEYINYLKKASGPNSLDEDSDEDESVPLLDYITWILHVPGSLYRKLKSNCTRSSKILV